jgi:hypothetical protein
VFNLFKKNSNLIDDYSDSKIRDIFCAEEARNLVTQARDKRRKDNRMKIFTQIKERITQGSSSALLHIDLFQDGNDTYFEGLGYQLYQVWIDPTTGEELTVKPVEISQPTRSPFLYTGLSHMYGGQLTYMKINWEK